MTVTIELFSQGEEIITGQTVDTNSAWLAEQLVGLGFKVTRHSTVGDDLQDLVDLLQEIAQRADACICTGGLGPTCDDLTAEAVAQAFATPLVFDPEAYAQIQAYFARRQRPMPETNRKQALLPSGAVRLDNHWGTAPGFALQQGRCWFAFVPGVPSEMRGLFNASIKPYLQQQYALQPSPLVTLKTVGLGESTLQELVKDIPLPAAVQLGFRAGLEEVQTKLRFPPGYPEPEKRQLVMQFADTIGASVFAIDGLEEHAATDLVSVLANLLNPSGQTLAVIETISQGLIAAKCIGQPWLLYSVYQRSLQRLTGQFGVTLNTDDLNATSLPLAQALREQSGADFGLVQLALLDTELNDPNIPLTLFMALASAQEVVTCTLTVSGNQERKQRQAAILALDWLRRVLQDK